jgi:menaquinol-cytochrome c reductase cytochrome b/c subunit
VRRGVATLVPLSLMLGACGGSSSDTARVRSVAQSYRDALAAHNGTEMCSLLSSDAQRKLAKLIAATTTARNGEKVHGCLALNKFLRELARNSKALSRIKQARIGVPKVLGAKATVLVREQGETPQELMLVKTSMGWKITFPSAETSPTFDLGGEPAIIAEPPPSVAHGGGAQLSQFYLGRSVTARSGCLACHRIGEAGNAGPGPDLTDVGSRLPPAGIERSITNPTAPMPSFRNLPKAKLKALVTFLSLLRE